MLDEKEIRYIYDTIKKLESDIDMKHILPKSFGNNLLYLS